MYYFDIQVGGIMCMSVYCKRWVEIYKQKQIECIEHTCNQIINEVNSP